MEGLRAMEDKYRKLQQEHEQLARDVEARRSPSVSDSGAGLGSGESAFADGQV